MANIKSTAETVDTVLSIGKAKSVQKLSSHVILGLLAGIYIGFGAVFAIKVTGNLDPAWGNVTKLLFGLAFPVGLLMVIIAGASLFTGDVMYMTSSYAAKETPGKTWWRYLLISYLFNFLGAVFLAFMVYESKILLDAGPNDTLPLASYAVNLANTKTSLPFLSAFLRGVLCNWLVCLAIFMSLAAQDCVSKAVLMWPPITTFVVLGMEHSVANMCFIPLGIFLGNSPELLGSGIQLTATWGSFFINNLIPVTLGNVLGGALFVALPYLRVSGVKSKSVA